MHSVDNNAEQPAGPDHAPDSPAHIVPRTAEHSGGRWQRQVTRAGAVAALISTAIGVTLTVQADSDSPAGASTAAVAGEPTVRIFDGNAPRGGGAAFGPAPEAPNAEPVSVGLSRAGATADPGAGRPIADSADTATVTTTAPVTVTTTESVPVTTTQSQPVTPTVPAQPGSPDASMGASFSATASLSVELGVPYFGIFIGPPGATVPPARADTPTVTVTPDPTTTTSATAAPAATTTVPDGSTTTSAAPEASASAHPSTTSAGSTTPSIAEPPTTAPSAAK